MKKLLILLIFTILCAWSYAQTPIYGNQTHYLDTLPEIYIVGTDTFIIQFDRDGVLNISNSDTTIKINSDLTMNSDIDMAGNTIQLSDVGGDVQSISTNAGDIEINSDAYQLKILTDAGVEVLHGISMTASGGNHINVNDNFYQFSNTGSTSSLKSAPLTGAQAWVFPNKSDTVAGLLDIASYWDRTGNYTYLNTIGDSVGIGTATPTEVFHVVGNGLISASLTTGTGLRISANDGGAIGASGVAFSELFLASGAVIDWASGDATITHSSNLINLSNANTRVDRLEIDGANDWIDIVTDMVFTSVADISLEPTGGDVAIVGNTLVGDGGDTLFFNATDTITNLVDVSSTTVDAYRSDSIIVGSYVEVGGVEIYALKQNLLDDGSIVLPTATCGFGTAQIGDSQEYTQFYWTTAGVVTLVNNTANVVNTDTDAKFCIFDSGTTVTIRNRLAATLFLRVNLTFSTN